MEKEKMIYDKYEYTESLKELIMSISAFVVSGGFLSFISFMPLPLIAKIPMTLISVGLLIFNDCLRIDSWEKYKEMKKLKDAAEKLEIEDNSTNKKKIGLFKKSKNNKNNSKVSINKKQNIFKKMAASFRKAKEIGNEPLDEELEETNNKKSNLFNKARNSIKKFDKSKLNKISLPLEEPIISYSFTKNGPQIAEVDLSNVHTEPGLHIETKSFGFENDQIDVKHFVTNREDDEVNNYVEEQIKKVTNIDPIYVDYNIENEEKRVYILTR